MKSLAVKQPIRQAFREWGQTDGVIWAFIFKVILANLIALWLAYRFELPQPTTVMATVCIVMQRHSGEVLAKSFWRVVGTLLGLTVMVILIAVFNQQPILFLLCMSVWIGLCIAGAARYRDFRGYACVLAGYTAAIIGLPSTAHPDEAFMTALWRVLEIGLGILCATLVTALVLPQSSSSVLKKTLASRMQDFAKAAVTSLSDRYDPALMHSVYAQFATQAVTLEALRNASSFEDPHMRLRYGRVGRLNNDFMVLAARLHSLSQLLSRLENADGMRTREHLEPCLAMVRNLLEPLTHQVFSEQDAYTLVWRLERQREKLMQAIRDARNAFKRKPYTPQALADFNTGAELLYRLTQNLHTYAQSHASLTEHRHRLENWPERFTTKANGLVAAAFGLRCTLVLCLASSFWLATAWPSGAAAVQAIGLTSGLSAVARQPIRQAWSLLIGACASFVVGFFLTFWVYPRIDGFVMLFCAMTPVLAFGAWLMSRPSTAGVGAGFLLWFCIYSVPGNPANYLPYPYLNTFFATLAGVLISALAMSLILHPERPWLWQRIKTDLRGQVVLAISGKLKGLTAYFESSNQDLVQQAILLTANHAPTQRHIVRLSFCVQEIGHALIELRQEQAALPLMQCYAAYSPWQVQVRAMFRAIARLFIRPSEHNRQRALAAVESALRAVKMTSEPFAPHFESSPLRRIASYLHFIRSALLDPRFPLLESST